MMFKPVIRFSQPRAQMALPRLSLPSQNIGQKPKPYLRSKQLERWAAELPVGNTTVTAHQMLEKLRTLNSSRYPARERIALHNALRATFNELMYAVRQPLRQANIPLDRQQLYRAELLQNLLEQMATGYKIVVSQLAMTEQLKDYDQLLLTEAIYLSMVYLNQRLVDTYSIYTTEPHDVWSDLNQLYQFAEANQLHLSQIDDPFPDTPLPVHLNIDFIYKRMILLALAEPYQLMQYETDDMYRLIASSVHGCVIENYSGLVTQGEYVIDLNADEGPRFINSDDDWHPVDPRVVDIGMVKTQLNVHLQRLLRSNANNAEFEVVSLMERQQRDMLLRLADAWNGSLIRKTKRFSLNARIELTSGLNAAHHFISEERSFTPEVDELKLATNNSQVHDEEWNSVFGTSYNGAVEKDRKHSQQSFQVNPWHQNNISPIGVALTCQQDDNNIEIKVGELVTYRESSAKTVHWRVGVVRWMRHEFDAMGNGIINIGIMNLANGALAVGTKASKGLGSGTDYFRAIMIPKNVANHQKRSLLVPALLYDIGTELSVNMNNKLIHVRLTRMLLSTRSFTQFDFDVIEQPLDYVL